MALELPHGADDLLRAAQQQQQQEAQLRAALDAALNAPHTIETITINATRLVTDGPTPVLQVATIVGKRYDIMVAPHVLDQLRRGAASSDGDASQS